MLAVLVMLRVFLVNPAGAEGWMIWAFFGLGVVAVSARVLGPVLQGSLSRTDYSRLVARLGRTLLSAPVPVLECWGDRRLKLIFLEDASSVSQATRAVALLFANVVILGGCLAVLLKLSGWLFVFALSIAVLDLGSQAYFWGRQKQRADAAFHDQADLHDAYYDLIGGVKELKSHQVKREAFIQEALRPALGSRVRGEGAEISGGVPASGGGMAMLVGGIVRLLFFVTIATVLIGFPRWGMASAGEITGYVIVFIFTMQPLEGIKLPVRLLARASGAMRRLGEFEAEAKPEQEESELLGIWPGNEWKRLVLEEVEYRAKNARGTSPPFRLGPLSAEILRGELVLVRGGSALGKNTFARLLSGLLTPGAGKILVDGEEVTIDLRENYRQLFSVVLGDFHVFASPWGLDWIGPNGLARRCSELMGIGQLIEWRDGRLEYPRPLSDLSLTERRKLALFGAIVEDRPVLVCDLGEAESDPEFREVFYGRIVKGLVSRGKTVVVMARGGECPIGHRVIELGGAGCGVPDGRAAS